MWFWFLPKRGLEKNDVASERCATAVFPVGVHGSKARLQGSGRQFRTNFGRGAHFQHRQGGVESRGGQWMTCAGVDQLLMGMVIPS